LGVRRQELPRRQRRCDGTADRPFDEIVPGTVTEKPEHDLVFADGAFLQGPAEKSP
jgi:hypothetical protein